MKKKIFILLSLLVLTITASGCANTVDYTTSVSDRRYDIFMYGDDDLTAKLYLGKREAPFVADGICGEVGPYNELTISFSENLTSTPNTVVVAGNGFGGEMSYVTTKNCFTLSWGEVADFDEQTTITLTYGKQEKECVLTSVLDDATLTCEQALDCVKEYAAERFAAFTQKGYFDGEIFIRLLYDEGCWYYVGLCDKSGNIYAYLVDPARGKVIAERQLNT